MFFNIRHRVLASNGRSSLPPSLSLARSLAPPPTSHSHPSKLLNRDGMRRFELARSLSAFLLNFVSIKRSLPSQRLLSRRIAGERVRYLFPLSLSFDFGSPLGATSQKLPVTTLTTQHGLPCAARSSKRRRCVGRCLRFRPRSSCVLKAWEQSWQKHRSRSSAALIAPMAELQNLSKIHCPIPCNTSKEGISV